MGHGFDDVGALRTPDEIFLLIGIVLSIFG